MGGDDVAMVFISIVSCGAWRVHRQAQVDRNRETDRQADRGRERERDRQAEKDG